MKKGLGNPRVECGDQRGAEHPDSVDEERCGHLFAGLFGRRQAAGQCWPGRQLHGDGVAVEGGHVCGDRCGRRQAEPPLQGHVPARVRVGDGVRRLQACVVLECGGLPAAQKEGRALYSDEQRWVIE